MHALLCSKPTLLTVAKTWKQPKYPPADERMKKMWCIGLAKTFIWVFPLDGAEKLEPTFGQPNTSYLFSAQLVLFPACLTWLLTCLSFSYLKSIFPEGGELVLLAHEVLAPESRAWLTEEVQQIPLASMKTGYQMKICGVWLRPCLHHPISSHPSTGVALQRASTATAGAL